MRKNILILTGGILLMALTALPGCRPAQTDDAIRAEDMAHKEKEGARARKAADAATQKVSDTEEWKILKSEYETKFIENDLKILSLKSKKHKPGTSFDALYMKKLDVLEQKNEALRAQMNSYEQNAENWALFKHQFSYDVNELGQALRQLGIDNRKPTPQH